MGQQPPKVIADDKAASPKQPEPAAASIEPVLTSDPPPIDKDVYEHGDLLLKVGENVNIDKKAVIYRVSSHVMASIAAFFETLLYGPFAEGKQQNTSSWIVSLPDDPDSFMIKVIGEAHTHLHKRDLEAYRDKLNTMQAEHTCSSAERLINRLHMVKTADKYNLMEYLNQELLDAWIKDDLLCAVAVDGHISERLWVLWTMGCEKRFSEQAAMLLRVNSLSKCPKNSDNFLIHTRDSNEFIIRNPPGDILDRIIQTRSDVLIGMKQVVEGWVNKLFNYDNGKLCKGPFWSGSSTEERKLQARQECCAAMYGSFSNVLHQINLVPAWSRQTKKFSLPYTFHNRDGAYNTLKKVKMLAAHRDCNPTAAFQHGLKTAYGQLKISLTDAENLYLCQQKASTKAGLARIYWS